jgi:small subunit ribosomal protein S6
MPLYECTFIARQDLSKQDVTKLAESFAAIIEAGKGKIIKNEYWGLKSLAYKIEKTRKGHYNMLGIDAPAEALKEMERNMRINENIVRVLTVRVDELDATPSVMMNQSRDRSDYAAEGEIIPDEIPVALAIESK